MTVLHLGTRDADAVIELLPNDVVVYRDKDSWEEWGEPMGDDAEHLVIRGADSAALLADVAWLIESGAPLARMEHDHQRGVIACITPDDDWSEPYYSVTRNAGRAR